MSSPDRGAVASARLLIEAVSKAFGGVPVLREVDLEAGPGEIVALLGANGAGKSTLMKILSGIYAADAGRILVDGKAVSIRSPQDAIAAGIRLLPQEISVHPDLTVAENIAIAALPSRRRLGVPFLSRREIAAQARALLDRLGLSEIAADRRMGSLGLPQQRIVEIARALVGKARILIMDEPTAALAEAEAEALFRVLDQLKAEGVTILYISHYLDEVFRLSDRVVVLRDGRIAGSFRTAETSPDEVLTAMLGAMAGELFPRKAAPGRPGDVVLAVDALSLPGWIADASFVLRRGEILGAFGLLGAGAEKVGRALYGAEPGARFAARLAGRPFKPASPREAIAAGFGFVAAERKREGLVAGLTVRENTTLPFLGRFVRSGFVERRHESEVTSNWIRTLSVRTSGPEQEIRFLSGGNQQKICLARWLVGDPKVLVLEEPTRGVDLGARREIYAEIRRLADAGLAVLLVSGDAEETAGLCDRTLVFREGRIAAEFGGETGPRDLLRMAAGHDDAPAAAGRRSAPQPPSLQTGAPL